jgi:hypothetical protein
VQNNPEGPTDPSRSRRAPAPQHTELTNSNSQSCSLRSASTPPSPVRDQAPPAHTNSSPRSKGHVQIIREARQLTAAAAAVQHHNTQISPSANRGHATCDPCRPSIARAERPPATATSGFTQEHQRVCRLGQGTALSRGGAPHFTTEPASFRAALTILTGRGQHAPPPPPIGVGKCVNVGIFVFSSPQRLKFKFDSFF